MVTSQSNDPPTPPGTASSAPPGRPAAGRVATAADGAPPVGVPECAVVTVPARQGLEAVDILRRGAGDAVGPVLHDCGGGTLGFLVPPGTAAAWDVPGSTCTETDGRGLRPFLQPPVEGSDWLLSPEEADPATDPAVLRAALDEARRLIEAADNCC